MDNKRDAVMKNSRYPVSAPQGENRQEAASINPKKKQRQKISERTALPLPLLFPFLMLSSILLSLLQG